MTDNHNSPKHKKMRIVINPNGTLTEINPETNKMLPVA